MIDVDDKWLEEFKRKFEERYRGAPPEPPTDSPFIVTDQPATLCGFPIHFTEDVKGPTGPITLVPLDAYRLMAQIEETRKEAADEP